MPWVLISVLILLIFLGVLAFFFSKKRKHKPDYYSFFIIGIIWFIFGIPLKSYTFSAMGLVFMIIGLANKDKWKENRRTWDNMDKQERTIYLGVTILLGILVAVGFLLWFLVDRGII